MTRSLGWSLFLALASTTLLVVGIVWLSAEGSAEVYRAALYALVGGLVISAMLSLVLADELAKPLLGMERAADRLARGVLTERVRSDRTDALGSLGRAIDEMADQLADRIASVDAESARLRTIVDAMVEAVLVTDDAGAIVMSNAALHSLLGRDPQGSSVRDVLLSPALGEAIASAHRGAPARVSFELDTARGTRALSAQVAPLPRGAGVVTVLHDVTDVLRADSVRRDFVANASHELRTPLTAIRGFGETLLDGAIDDPAIARRFAQNITDNAVRLQRLVDDLLELSRAESPDVEIELEPVSAHEVAAKVVRSLEGRAAEKGITVTVIGAREDGWCLAEPRALDHVLMNLVENAIKYSPRGARVEVRIEPVGERLRIFVKDDGPGIAAHHLPRIFERFYRVDPGRSREQGGTGLGLSIVRHLTTRMEGDIAVESRLGTGTTFTVTLARPRVSGDEWAEDASAPAP